MSEQAMVVETLPNGDLRIEGSLDIRPTDRLPLIRALLTDKERAALRYGMVQMHTETPERAVLRSLLGDE